MKHQNNYKFIWFDLIHLFPFYCCLFFFEKFSWKSLWQFYLIDDMTYWIFTKYSFHHFRIIKFLNFNVCCLSLLRNLPDRVLEYRKKRDQYWWGKKAMRNGLHLIPQERINVPQCLHESLNSYEFHMFLYLILNIINTRQTFNITE